MEYYTLIGESDKLNAPDIEFPTTITNLDDARRKAINILNNPKYKGRFWGISLFRYGKYKGMVSKSDRGYRFLYNGKSVKLYKNGTVD